MQTILIILGVMAFMAIFALREIRQKRRLDMLSETTCAGRSWRRGFPVASKDDIRRFHRIVLDAFMIPERYFLRLVPGAKLSALYDAVTAGGIDSLEYEHLHDLLDQHFGVDLEATWHPELTLGELFSHTQSSS